MPVAKDGKYAMNPAVGKKMAEARESDKGKKGHRLRSVRIEAANNGFTVTHSLERRTTPKKDESSYVPDPAPFVFGSWAEVLAHVKQHEPEAE